MKALSFIPAKHSRAWGLVSIIFLIVTFSLLVLSQLLLHRSFTLILVAGLAIIAIVCTLVACIGGFLGGKLFFAFSSGSTLLGLLYMLYIVVFSVADGWNDIVSIVSFAVIYSFGTAAGIIAEGVYYLYSTNKFKTKSI